MQKQHRNCGLTLIEIVVVMTIVALLAVISFPAYKTYLIEARRNDGIVALRQNQALVENYIEQNGVTPTSSQVTIATTSQFGFYTIAYTQVSSSQYQLVATAVSTTSQNNDTGCTVLTMISQMDDVYPVNCH